MSGKAVMDFEDYQSELSNEKKQCLEYVSSGTLTRVQQFIDFVWNSNQKDGLFNYILLVTALRRKHKSIIKFLINGNCPVKVSKKTGCYCTPLYYAVQMSDPDIFRALWKRGASIWDKDANDETALELAMTRNQVRMINLVLNDIRLSKTTIDLKPDREDHIALFHAACFVANFRAIKLFTSLNFTLRSRSGFNHDDWKGFTPFHFALLKSSDNETIVYLLKCGDYDLFATDEQGRTPLHLALKENCDILANERVIEHIVSLNGEKVTNPVDKSGLSHFHIVCSIKSHDKDAIKHRNYVKNLINSKIDVNSSVSSDDPYFPGYTALHFATKMSCWSTLELLLENGADPTIADKNGSTPLHMLCKLEKLELDKQLKIVKLLLHHGADPAAKNFENRTPLHELFCAHTSVCALHECEKLLLSKNQQGVNHRDEHGISYLHIACTGEDLGIVKTLVINGASVNSHIHEDSPQYPGYSALLLAVQLNRLEIVEFLLAQGADANKCTAEEKTTPLHLACVHDFELLSPIDSDDVEIIPSQKDHIQMVESLIKHGASVNAQDSSGITPLLENCLIPKFLQSRDYFQKLKISKSLDNELFTRQKKVMDILLRHGADINARSSYGGSILHVFSGNSHSCPMNKDLVEFALKNGANIEAVDENTGFTPLHVAVKDSVRSRVFNPTLISLLLEHGANVNAKSISLETPLHLCVESYLTLVQVDCYDCLLDHPDIDVNIRNIDGQTPLHLAMERPNYLTEKLLNSGADINAEDAERRSPMHILLSSLSGTFRILYGELYDRVLKVVVTHVKKLLKLKLYVSEKVIRDFGVLLQHLRRHHIDVGLGSIDSSIDEEVEHLKSVKLDNYTTLYDIMFKDPNALAKHVLNNNLKAAIFPSLWKSEFPNFGGFIKRQYVVGCARLSVLEPAKSALDLISNVNWPNSCSEKILSFVRNEDLRNLIESATIEMKRKRKADDETLLEKSPTKVARFAET